MREKYACDFEATTDPSDCRVWAWQFMNIHNLKDTKQGTKLDDFMQWLLSKERDVYFHNLRYDGSFILNWLFRNGYTVDREKNPKEKTFTAIISENGQWYSIDITTGYTSKGKGKRKRKHITIYDSSKKLPFKIKQIAIAFKLPILKGDLDYDKYRSPEHELTEEEKAYLHCDTEILARALEIQFSQELTAMTIGSDAMKDFKNRITPQQFDKFFPVLSKPLDDFLRASYKGGFTWVNPLFQGQDIHGGQVYDVNSLYPSVMRNSLLPYGDPIFFQGEYKKDEKYPLYIIKFKCEFELKKDHIPTVQIKNSRFLDNEYLTTSDGEQQTLTMTSVDLQLLFDHYDVYNIEWLEGYKFRAYRGFFDDYIDYWSDIKKNNEGAIRELAKLMLNNLYGKFGKNPDVTPKIPYLKEDGALGLSIPRDEEGKELREYTDPVYIPMGSFITAYARDKTIRTAQKCYDRILYCDTDSIHLKGKDIPQPIENEIHPKELGFWAHECTFERAKFLRQKTYVEQYYKTRYSEKKKYKFTYLKTDIKCAGMPDELKKSLRYEDFKIGLHKPDGRLKPKQVPNGVVLVQEQFTLK